MIQIQKQKIHFQNYEFQLHFKTQLCVSMSVLDTITQTKYQNNNVQFKKLQKNTIISALRKKSPKQLTCKISEVLNIKSNYLLIQFRANFDYIQPFSQQAVVYQTSKMSEYDIIPQKLSKQKALQMRNVIEKLDKSLSFDNDKQQKHFKLFTNLSTSLSRTQQQTQKELGCFVVMNVIIFILFCIYLTFLQYIGLQIVLLLSWWIYYRSSKFQLQSIQLKAGLYKIDVSGQMLIYNSNQNNRDSFKLYAYFGPLENQHLKIHIKATYSYPYPFTGTFLVKSEEQQTLKIMVQKNVKFQTTTISNLIVTVQKIPQLIL